MKYFAALLLAPLLAACPAAEEEEKLAGYEVIKISKSGSAIDCKGDKFNKGKLTELQIVTSSKNIPTDVTVRNCKIYGSIRIAGLGFNGESKGVTESSKDKNHTKQAQQAAPKRILLENLEITGKDRIPLYLSPGANEVTLRNSKLLGKSNSVAIYMEAESARNSVIGNSINVQTGQSREVIALDGSADNTVSGNTFSLVTHGGIYLYRNCGEGGTVRHQSPQRNLIENNNFDLSRLNTGYYGIWLGSRNGNRNYCEDDKGYPFGSSIDNRDFADNNVVKNNSFAPARSAIRNNGQGNQIN